MPYLVATDLDGTLLRDDATVSQRTRTALRMAARSGVEVIYATGRPPRWLPDVYDATEHQPLTICANGSLTLLGDETVHVDPIPEPVVEEVRRTLIETFAGVQVRTEQWRGHTLKLLAAVPDGDPESADAMLADVQGAVGHLVEPTHSAFRQLLIEMSPHGVTKAKALQRMRQTHWPDHTVIAVGDMPNDLAMLAAADIPVTVSSGHQSLQDIAAHVLPGPHEDGVAQLLERLVAGHVL